MSDTIYRQDVLNELDGCDYELKDWQRWKLKTMVRDIPSAQPEPCDDLVSREAVSEWLKQYGQDVLHGKYKFSLMYIWKNLMGLPSAQPQRKKGKWIPVDSFSAFGGDEAMWMAHGNPVAFYYCSECKEQAYAGEDGESLLTDFCPSCGADMRGESDE